MLARCDDDEHQDGDDIDGDDIEPGELVVVESERGVLRGVLVRWRRLVVRAPACAPAPTAVQWTCALVRLEGGERVWLDVQRVSRC